MYVLGKWYVIRNIWIFKRVAVNGWCLRWIKKSEILQNCLHTIYRINCLSHYNYGMLNSELHELEQSLIPCAPEGACARGSQGIKFCSSSCNKEITLSEKNVIIIWSICIETNYSFNPFAALARKYLRGTPFRMFSSACRLMRILRIHLMIYLAECKLLHTFTSLSDDVMNIVWVVVSKGIQHGNVEFWAGAPSAPAHKPVVPGGIPVTNSLWHHYCVTQF